MAAIELESQRTKEALERERDDAVAEAREALRASRHERAALFSHFTSEAAKAERVVRARLAGELAEAEKRAEAFWTEKSDALRAGHEATLKKLADDRESAVEAMVSAEKLALKSEFAGEKRALRALMSSEASKSAKIRAAAAEAYGAKIDEQSRAFAGEKKALEALFKSEANKSKIRLAFAVEEEVKAGAARLAAAEAQSSAEKDALKAGFGRGWWRRR